MTTLLNYSFAREHGVTVADKDGTVTLVYLQQAPLSAIAEAVRLAPNVERYEQCEKQAFDALLTAQYQENSGAVFDELADSPALDQLLEAVDDSGMNEDLLDDSEQPIKKLINAILSDAIDKKVSDVHIETYESDLIVRYRKDGVLETVIEQHRKASSMIVSRIKVMAGLDIAQKRIPQDGRVMLRILGRSVDVRVSVLPTSFGERVVLRLMSTSASALMLDDLGMSADKAKQLGDLIANPNGVILVSGPTGSGKTTTLYAALNQLNTGKSNIMTVEDPIEYDLKGISQTQVNTKANMTFASALRAILRQDPDVVMVGEIRDKETADISVQASLTGHLVLSTIHTNSAVGVVSRLTDMKIEPFMLSSSLVGVVSQRLVRKLCSHCKRPSQLELPHKEMMGLSSDSDVTVYEPTGCKHCNDRGYDGQIGVFEILSIDQKAKQLISEGASEIELNEHFDTKRNGLFADGVKRVLDGSTSMSEVLRVIGGFH